MMGTSLLAMPWALQQAGFGLGIFFILLMGLTSFYTAYIVIKSPNGIGFIFFLFASFIYNNRIFIFIFIDTNSSNLDFSDVCKYFYGKMGGFIANFTSIFVIFGGIIVYFILMCNFLYFSGTIFYGRFLFFF